MPLDKESWEKDLKEKLLDGTLNPKSGIKFYPLVEFISQVEQRAIERTKNTVNMYRQNHHRYPMKRYEGAKVIMATDYNKGYRQALEDVYKGISTTPLQESSPSLSTSKISNKE